MFIHDPGLDLWRIPACSSDRSIRHAGGRSGRVGNHSRAPQRTLPRRRARANARVRLSVGYSHRGPGQQCGVCPAQAAGICLGAGRIRDCEHRAIDDRDRSGFGA